MRTTESIGGGWGPWLRARWAVLVLSLLTCGASARPAGAQEPDREGLRRTVSALDDSAAVRVIAPGVYVDPGLFLGVRGDSVALADGDALLSVGFDEIEQLAVRRSRWSEGAATAGTVGTLVGAAFGFLLGANDCGSRPAGCGEKQREGALVWGGALGVAGALAGAAIGSRLRSWRTLFP